MKVKVKYKKVIDQVILPEADLIDRTRLGNLLGVTRARAQQMIAHHDIPAEYIPLLRRIRLQDVISHRKANIREAIKKGEKA